VRGIDMVLDALHRKNVHLVTFVSNEGVASWLFAKHAIDLEHAGRGRIIYPEMLSSEDLRYKQIISTPRDKRGRYDGADMIKYEHANA
jgi:hypothetical protein